MTMNDNDQATQAIARQKGSQRFSSSRRTNDDEKSVSRYTFFTIGLISFFAGSWAIICLFFLANWRKEADMTLERLPSEDSKNSQSFLPQNPLTTLEDLSIQEELITEVSFGVPTVGG